MNLFSIWLKELKSFFQYYANNWTFLVFQYDSKNWTFFKMLKELNLSSIWITFWHDSNWTLFDQYDSKSRIFSQKMTQSVEHLFEFDWKSWTFFALDSQNWTFFNFMTQRIEAFCVWVQNWILKKKKKNHHPKMTQRIEPFRNMTHRIDFWNEKDSLNGTLLFTDRSEPFFSTWLTVLNPSFNMTQRMNFFWLTQKKNWTLCQKKSQRVELFFSAVKNCFFSFSIWLEELITFFSICLKELNFFSWIWPTELNLFSIWLKEFWTFQKLWLSELNPHRKKNDSKNVLKAKKWLNELNL